MTGGYGAYPPQQQPFQQRPAQQGGDSLTLLPEQQVKLRKDLDITQQNCKVLSDMLTELKPGQTSQQDVELLQVIFLVTVQIIITCSL